MLNNSCTSIRMGGINTNPETDDGANDGPSSNEYCYVQSHDANCADLVSFQRRFCPCEFRQYCFLE